MDVNIEYRVKRLRMEHAFNMRDMGGYETIDGRVTAFGKLLRSDGIHSLSNSEWDRLKQYGVRTVLDLRSDAEIQANADRVPEGILWLHCPMQKEQIDLENIGGSALKAFTDSLTEGYLNMVKKNGVLLAAALKELIDGLSRGAVLFHCSAGKDRTGVLASAVYYLAGVEREDIIADYEVTYTYNKRGINRLLTLADEGMKQRMTPYLASDAASMERLIALYEEINLPVYLADYGLTEKDVELLKKHFVKNLSFPIDNR